MSPYRIIPWIVFAPLVAALAFAAPGADETADPAPVEYAEGRQIATLANRQITESSGLACGRRTANVFWTHNDSGDGPRLFAFGPQGEHLGTVTVSGAKAHDWEDMASFQARGLGFLLLGDVGDNNRRRKTCTLYIVPEPPVGTKSRPADATVRVAQTILFTYDDGPRDCESVAIDPTSGTILLASKAGRAKVYALPWPKRPTREPLVAKAIAALTISAPTAMDISPDGRRAVVLTYGDAYEYVRGPKEKWSAAFGRKPRKIAMPKRRQGESICYGPDGKTLYLTSEFAPAPLLEVPPKKADDEAAPKPDRPTQPSKKL